MVFIRAHTFCFCLPVRLGIFAVTILGLLVGGSLSICGWIEVKHMAWATLSRRGEIALCLQTVMFTLLALVSIFGFIAISARRRNLLFVFGIMLLIHLLANVGSGSFSIYSLFREEALDWSEQCDAAVSRSEQCRRKTTIIKAVVTTFFIVMWIFQFYGVVLVANFVGQVEEEKSEKAVPPPTTKDVDTPSSFPVTTYNSFAGASYPFTQPPNGHTMV